MKKKVQKKREMIQVREEINEMRSRKSIEKINKNKD